MAKKYKPMDEVTGASREIQLGGRTLKAVPIRMKDLGEARALIKSRRRRAYQEFVSSLPKEERPDSVEQRKEKRDIWNSFVSDFEVGQFVFGTLEGMIWFLHKALSEHQPDLTMEDIEDLLQEEGQKEAQDKVEDLGRFSGFTFGEEAGETSKKGSQEERGGKS